MDEVTSPMSPKWLMVILLTFHCWDKIPNIHRSLKEEMFILIHNFWGFNPWLAGSKVKVSWWKGMTEQSCLAQAAKEQRTGEEPESESLDGAPMIHSDTLRNVLC